MTRTQPKLGAKLNIFSLTTVRSRVRTDAGIPTFIAGLQCVDARQRPEEARFADLRNAHGERWDKAVG